MLEQLLANHRPRTEEERADLARMVEVADGPDPWTRASALHCTASAFIVDGAGRVLLRWHERQQAWIQVGGHGDPGETDALAIALREGAEETGLDDLRPLPAAAGTGPAGPVHVVIVPVPAAKGEPAHEHADIRFVLRTDSPDRIRPEDDRAELRWLSFDEARRLTTEANVRESLDRVETAVAG
ncbi:MAG: NUDIX domain-containing protein [Actinomycetota bacterium]